MHACIILSLNPWRFCIFSSSDFKSPSSDLASSTRGGVGNWSTGAGVGRPELGADISASGVVVATRGPVSSEMPWLACSGLISPTGREVGNPTLSTGGVGREISGSSVDGLVSSGISKPLASLASGLEETCSEGASPESSLVESFQAELPLVVSTGPALGSTPETASEPVEPKESLLPEPELSSASPSAPSWLLPSKYECKQDSSRYMIGSPRSQFNPRWSPLAFFPKMPARRSTNILQVIHPVVPKPAIANNKYNACMHASSQTGREFRQTAT